jgi:type III restriction enzyme
LFCNHKLEFNFYIETPAGKYTPDWAVVVEKEKQTKVYFVAETKDTDVISNLRQEEQLKILSARAMFNQLMPEVVFKAPIKDFDQLNS